MEATMLPRLPAGARVTFALQEGDAEFPVLDHVQWGEVYRMVDDDAIMHSSERSGGRPLRNFIIKRPELITTDWLYHEVVRQLSLIGRRVQLATWMVVNQNYWPRQEEWPALHALIRGGALDETLPLADYDGADNVSDISWRYWIKDPTRLPPWFVRAHRAQCTGDHRGFRIELYLPNEGKGPGTTLIFRGGTAEELFVIRHIVAYHSARVGVSANRTRMEIDGRPGMAKIIVWELSNESALDYVAALRQLSESIGEALYFDVTIVEP